jgi:hypothetical protein
MRKILCGTAVLAMTLCSFAQTTKPVAELPRVYIDSTYVAPVGTVRAAHTSAELTSALTAAAPGDTIVLDAGAVYSGNFSLPAKSNPTGKWIYVISSALVNLPEHVRVSPGVAGNMPKIVSPNVSQAISIKDGANHWRFSGIEFYSASTFKPKGIVNYQGYALISNYGNSIVTLPDSIWFDRCYVHGDATHDLQRAITSNFSNAALVDSYISDIHYQGAEANALGVWWTPGPIKVVNNYLEASTENVLIGGAGGKNNPYVPSDIEFRNNYLYKPPAWFPLSKAPINQMSVKNSFELKSAQRVLVDGNTIENNWVAGQNGYAVVFTVRSSASGDVAVVNDVTFTNNLLKNVAAGFNTLATDDNCGIAWAKSCGNSGSQTRWNITNNLILLASDPTWGYGAVIAINSGKDRITGVNAILKDVVYQHNTAVSPPTKACWADIYSAASGTRPYTDKVSKNLWFLDNVMCRQPYGDNGLQGMMALNEYLSGPTVAPNDITARYYGNLMAKQGDPVHKFPAGNKVLTALTSYWVDAANGNYELTLPWMTTSDGKPAGYNHAELQKHIVVAPGALKPPLRKAQVR